MSWVWVWYGQCHRNGIASERIEKQVVEYTKKLINNEKFVDYVKMKIGKSVDVCEIEKELDSYDKKMKLREIRHILKKSSLPLRLKMMVKIRQQR